MSKLNDINTEIARLEKERHELLNKENSDNEKFIKSLTWTKECVGQLKISALRAAGLPTYSILVSGKNCPTCYGVITVMGDSNLYEYNVLYGRNYMQSDYYSFYTSSEEMLLKFMEKVEFSKFFYDESDWRVLDAARKKAAGI